MFGGFFANIQSSIFQYTPFLENLTVSPEFAWSVWQPHSSVTNCVRLRRDSDNAELDFGYVNGYLDTSSITSWAGSANLYVVTFYGFGRNATELVTANQQQFNLTGMYDNQAGIDLVLKGTVRTYALSSIITAPTTFHLFLPQNKTVRVTNSSYTFSCGQTSGFSGYFYWTSGGAVGFRPNSSFVINSGFNSDSDLDVLTDVSRDSGDLISVRYDRVDNGSRTIANAANILHLFGIIESGIKLPEMTFFNSQLSTADLNQYYSDYNTRYNKSI